MSIKLKIAASVMLMGSLAVTSLVMAQTTPLSVTCFGSVATNVITWTATPANGTAPYTYVWSGNVSGTSSVVSATYGSIGTYQATVQVNDSATSTATATCQATVTALPSVPPTSTPPMPFMNRPMLNVNAEGNFLAKGMRVISVGSGSFTGQVWGVTYTINYSGNVNGWGDSAEFYMRQGLTSTSTIQTQVQVGDEVGVSGRVDILNPFVVTAKVVRDYSIIMPRKEHNEDENENGGGKWMNSNNSNGQGNNGNGNGNGENKGDRGDRGESMKRLNDLFGQLKSLQDLFRNKFGNEKHDN